MEFRELDPKTIIVEDRDRLDYGDLDILAASIKRYGLLQPPTVTQDLRLIAGGRRLKACVDLLQWSKITVGIRTTETEAELKELELEENVRRKELSWQETVTAVVKIHKAHKKEAALKGKEWTDEMTGELLGGYSKAYVWQCRDLLPFLSHPDIQACKNLTEAVRLRARWKEDEALKILATKFTNVAKTALPANVDDAAAMALLNEDLGTNVPGVDVVSPQPTVEASKEVYEIPLSNMLFKGNCLDIMANMKEGEVDHILTDPPYAIDMEMLEQSSGLMDVSSVRETHDVAENLTLFSKMFPHFYRITQPAGFVVLWCDIEHWHLLKSLAIDAGFRVQRWPICWCKTSTCKNEAAQYNFTKNVEIAMVCRKPKATLVHCVGTSYILAENDQKIKNPFAKPFEVWRFLLDNITLQGQTILDPFAGEGSSITASINCLRRCVGIELLDPVYNALVENIKQLWISKLGPNCSWV